MRQMERNSLNSLTYYTSVNCYLKNIKIMQDWWFFFKKLIGSYMYPIRIWGLYIVIILNASSCLTVKADCCCAHFITGHRAKMCCVHGVKCKQKRFCGYEDPMAFVLAFFIQKVSCLPLAHWLSADVFMNILRTDTVQLILILLLLLTHSLPRQCLQSATFVPPQKPHSAWRPKSTTSYNASVWWTFGRMAGRKGLSDRSCTCQNPPCTASSSNTASATRWRISLATADPKNPDWLKKYTHSEGEKKEGVNWMRVEREKY